MWHDYTIELTIEYEGHITLTFHSLENLIHWIKTNGITYDWDIDNLTITGPKGPIGSCYTVEEIINALS